MKRFFYAFLAMLLIGNSITAFGTNPPDEGMWLPMLVNRLNYTDMKKMGLQLTPDELYNINRPSLKDAIVQLDGGSCTAEIVSKEGLMLTNHHCAYGAVQAASSVQNDYLTDGFWAFSKKEEIKTDMTATFLVRMEDVTSQVLDGIDYNTSASDRSTQIRTVVGKLRKEYSEKGKYTVVIKDFFEGNEFYMFIYETYKDVRLVGIPPSSVGKYGGDTDNWMWPRHTGDFSFLRVYTAPDGSPAEFSENNIPLVPKHHLPVSIKELKKDDFVMIWGYPGSTDRYLSSWGVQEVLNHTAPTIISVRERKLEIMKEGMNASSAVRIQYAAKHAQTANYWKYYIGQSKGLKALNVVDKKRAIEKDFANWVSVEPERQKIYGNVLSDIEAAYKESAEKLIQRRMWYFQETFMGAEALWFVWKLQTLPSALKKKDSKPAGFDVYRAMATEQFKDYNEVVDQKLFAALIEMYYTNIPQEYHPAIFAELNKKYKGDYTKMARDVYSKSVVTSEERFNDFLNKPNEKKWNKDMAVRISQSIIETYFAMQQEMSAIDSKMQIAKRLFIDGMRKMYSNKVFYPDANSTMRLTYGQILDYIPADAVHYDFITTQKGILDKEDPNNDEFVLPAKLKDLLLAKDFGPYGKNGELPVCFIANTDITGGNSGSPMINAEGELVGIAFDGNWEAMSGDIAFEPALQRTIGVDMRYVLFIVDKYAGAKNLIKEMDIRK